MRDIFVKPRAGQSLAEYTLIGGLVVLASMGAVGLLGGSLNLSMEKLLASLLPAPVSSSSGALPAGNTPGPGNNPYSVASNGALAGVQPIVVDLGAGKSVVIPNFPTDSLKVYETAGASGVTEATALTLIQLANALKDKGEISDQQASSLIALANQGHKIGKVIKAIEGNNNQPTIQFEGTTWNTGNLAHSISVRYDDVTALNYGLQPDKTIQLDNVTSENASGFINLYNKAITSSEAASPVVKELVAELSRRILNVTDNFSTAVEFNPTEWQSSPHMSEISSALVKSDSKVICITGNGADSGKKCS